MDAVLLAEVEAALGRIYGRELFSVEEVVRYLEAQKLI